MAILHSRVGGAFAVLQAVVANTLLQQGDTGLDLLQFQVFVGLVGPVDGESRLQHEP